MVLRNSVQRHRGHRDTKKCFYVSLCLCVFVVSIGVRAQTIEVKNNQPFAIAMPWTMRDIGGKDATVLVNVAANATQTIDLAAAPQDSQASINVEPAEKGIH